MATNSLLAELLPRVASGLTFMSSCLRLLTLGAVLLICLRLSPPEDGAAQAPGPNDQAFVHNGFVRVIDGDTVEIWRDDRRWGIGLIGIDAPEGNTACGMSAAARMWELTAQGAKFRSEAGVPDEKYRLMYHADTLGDLSIEETLVSEGLAKVDARGGKENARLRQLESDARRERRGCVWGDKGGPPPVKRKFPPKTEPSFADGVPVGNLAPSDDHEGHELREEMSPPPVSSRCRGSRIAS
jgi:endonuclease YncB( thermonuclease family)